MSQDEARRVYIVEQLVAGRISVPQAAQLLTLSERQVKRLKKGVKQHGVAFLAHKNRGRKPKHAIPQEVRDTVISLALDPNKYKDASCQQMSELLAQYQDIKVSARSIHRILTTAGIPLCHVKKRPKHRRSRDRMSAPGMLVQCDASPFAWFESRGPWATLHGAIDDATGNILGLFFRPNEDLFGYLQVLAQVLTRHGIPMAIYSDQHAIFFSPNKNKLSIEEELAGKKAALTQFGRALSELGIGHIPALSPQAKGRIERLWETLQNRLVIELRLAGISSIDEANAFLTGFISRFNAKFAVSPAQPESAFRPCPDIDLDLVLCRKDSRKASSGSTISFLGKTYQLLTPSGAVLPLHPKTTITVVTHLDGSISALCDDKPYLLKECQHITRQQPSRPIAPENSARKYHSPPTNHPWRQPASLPTPKQPNTSSWRERRYWGEIYAQR